MAKARSMLLDSSSGGDENLPPELLEVLDTNGTEETDPPYMPEHPCPVCGAEVEKLPGQKRRRKYHDECKPTRGATTSTARTVRVTRKDEQAALEVEAALDRVSSGLRKAVMLLSLVDPYDAFVLHVNAPEIVENMRPVLMRFPWLREQASNASAGASIFGLALTVFTTCLPIAAHHGWIPSKKIAQLLVGMPMFMLRMQQGMANSDDGDMSAELLARIQEETKRQQEQRMRQRTAEESVHATSAR